MMRMEGAFRIETRSEYDDFWDQGKPVPLGFPNMLSRFPYQDGKTPGTSSVLFWEHQFHHWEFRVHGLISDSKRPLSVV